MTIFRKWQFKTGLTGLIENMQPDPGSNWGPSADRVNAPPTELTDYLHIIHLYVVPVSVRSQVTPATLLPLFL